jgi:hypothetical protein
MTCEIKLSVSIGSAVGVPILEVSPNQWGSAMTQKSNYAVLGMTVHLMCCAQRPIQRVCCQVMDANMHRHLSAVTSPK